MPSHLSQSPCNVSTITSIYVFSYVPFMYTLTQRNMLNNDLYLVVDSYLIFHNMTLDLDLNSLYAFREYVGMFINISNYYNVGSVE